jgi:hypothetical protein
MLFVFDENYSTKISKGLQILESGNIKSPIRVDVAHITDFVPTGTKDLDVIKEVGNRGGIIFTKDKDFKQVRLLAGLFKQCNVGVTFFAQPKKALTYWDNVKVLVQNWENIKGTLADDSPPFVYEIKSNSVQKYELK